MKFPFKYFIWVVFFALLVANVYVFITGVKLSEEIAKYEDGIKTYKQENIVLEKQVYEAGSLSYAASVAQDWNFTKKATPIYLDNHAFALNR